ncbi:3-dehydroquinate synthase [Peribacillus psychrosaccharolyticus]|uniref:3-dehydroquinate synthase n=1 Tax=Peribacillus psychrosaccharolyticus TaxID=1407 RepID=UPI003D273115
MEIIDIKTSKSYPVYVGQGAIEALPEFINRYSQISRILLITDEKVAGIHLHRVKEMVEKTGKPVEVCIVPEGEHAKTFEVFYQCQSFALAHNLNRKSLVLALGGGAVGDLAGFVASTFMRGIPFIQLPTTLLAHDSAVGGKVAINHPEGKNMIGVFYQPDAVFYDLDFLKTLPEKELRSGFAEVIKHALIDDSDFYQWLITNIKNLNSITDEQYLTIVKRGIEVKAAIVAADEREEGVRAYLNFGHTLGHAIEAAMGYGNFTHGESILIGTVFALNLSLKKQDFPFNLAEFVQWVQSLGYQTNIPETLQKQTLLSNMKKDKKTISEQITFVLLAKLGKPYLTEVDDRTVMGELKRQ